MVNINEVYKIVLTITNKDNRGYITPEEFNNLADQAQNEIFEGYFNKQVLYESGVAIDTDFSDPVLIGTEKINLFYANSSLTLSNNSWALPNDLYKIGVVSVNGVDADLASHKDLKYINLSPLTAPVSGQPVYIITGSSIKVYPTTITSGVSLEYLKKPNKPKWGYLMPSASQIASGVPNEPIYDSTVFNPSSDDYNATAKSLNFELHASEKNDLVYKILTLAGVTIKQNDIAGFAQSKDQQLQTTEQ
tara:strand:- start:776 stop:1519 length:744 start_codon:yes stop_codon:yes gene_type:complete